jgi:hypothetical protein
MSWQVLPDGSQDPIAQGQGGSYEDCVKQAFEAAVQIASEAAGGDAAGAGAPPAGDPAAAGGAPVPAGPPAAGPPADDKKKAAAKKTADDASTVAKPDERTDVDKLPSYDTLTDTGTFDSADYANNAGDDLAKPVDGSDVQNFAPGGAPFTSDNRTAGAIKAGELVEIEMSVGTFRPKSRAEKFARVAAYENAPALIVNDRIAVLSAVEKVIAHRESSRPRGVVPQRAAVAKRVPNMGQRSASRAVLSATEQQDDYLLTI